MAKDYPIGKAQQMVLDALGMSATSYTDADEKFAVMGLVVSAKREGRKSVPVVRLTDGGAGWSVDGEGETWTPRHSDYDLTAIQQWIEK